FADGDAYAEGDGEADDDDDGRSTTALAAAVTVRSSGRRNRLPTGRLTRTIASDPPAGQPHDTIDAPLRVAYSAAGSAGSRPSESASSCAAASAAASAAACAWARATNALATSATPKLQTRVIPMTTAATTETDPYSSRAGAFVSRTVTRTPGDPSWSSAWPRPNRTTTRPAVP